MTRTVSAEAQSSPVVCSGHKWRKAEKTPVPDEVHFKAAAPQDGFYKTKGEQVKKTKTKQLRTILTPLHSSLHWMPSPACGP